MKLHSAAHTRKSSRAYTHDLLGLIYVLSLPALRLLRRFHNWSQRRLLQLLILALPLASLTVLTGTIIHVTVPRRMLSAPTWDHLLDTLVLLLVSCFWVGTLLFGAIRLVLMKQLMLRKECTINSPLQESVNAPTSRRGLSSVHVRLTHSPHPIALLYGIRQPTILLSTWMLHYLDAPELEVVLTHELEHVSRRNYLINWCALLLRDAFFYLSTRRIAYRQFSQEKELACNDKVVSTTQRPLALASALTKGWLYLAEHPQTSHAPLSQALLGSGEHITHRVDRLLAVQPGTTQRTPSSCSLETRLFIGTLASLVGATSILLTLIQSECWPPLLTLHTF